MRRKTTMYVDSDLLIAVKIVAAGKGRREYEVVEDALRDYMQGASLEESSEALRGLMGRMAARAKLTDEEALEIANEEVHAARDERKFA